MKQKLMSMVLGLGAAALMTVSQAQAGLFLDFEDLSGSGSIPAGYNGFAWVGNWQFATDTAGNTYVFSSGLSELTIQRSNGGLFSLEGADFASLSAAAGSVTVSGYNNGALIGTVATGALNTTFSTLQITSLVNIDTLVFSGGNWRMDNFNDSVAAPVPEPATIIAGALLLLPFGASTLRILRKNHAA